MRIDPRRWPSPFAWLRDDLRAIAALLKKPETWVFIGLGSIFAALGGVSLYLTTGLDPTLTLRNLRSITCSATGNLLSAALIVAGVTFGLAAIAALGELANYVDDRRRYRERPSGRNVVVVTAIAVASGGGLLAALLVICH